MIVSKQDSNGSHSAIPSVLSGLALTIEHVPDLSSQGVWRKWFLDKGCVGIQHSVVNNGLVGVPGHEQDLHFRTSGGNAVRHLAPAHFWHDDIGEEQMYSLRIALTD